METLEKEASKDRNGVQVIARAAAILHALKDHRSGRSLAQIAKDVDLPRSTVQRIITALAKERLVLTGAKGGSIRLGPELGVLANAASNNVVERCRKVLAQISHETGETTDLAVLRDDEMIFLDQVPGMHRLRTVSSVGDAFPLTVTANGRACLALIPEDHARKRIEAEWAKSGTKGSIESMLKMLANIRARGIAYDIDEHTPGISAAGFAFQDLSGNYYAVSVPVPSMRFRETRRSIEDALERAKANLEEEVL